LLSNMTDKYKLATYFKNPFVVFYSFLRILAGIFIPFNLVWGFVVTLFLDALDGPLFEQIDNLVGMPMSVYMRWDKYLDWWGYVFMYLTSLNFGFNWILVASLLFRLVGQLLFEKTKKHHIFVFFPNFFEAFFLWYVVFAIINFSPKPYWLVIIVVVYWIREVLLHIYWPNRLRKYGYPKWQIKYFGVRKDFIE